MATLSQAVSSPQYVVAATKALSRKGGVYTPPEDDLPHDLKAADKDMAEMEVGLFNTRAVPSQLQGCKKYAIIYQDIMSPRFFEALKVCVGVHGLYVP